MSEQTPEEITDWDERARTFEARLLAQTPALLEEDGSS